MEIRRLLSLLKPRTYGYSPSLAAPAIRLKTLFKNLYGIESTAGLPTNYGWHFHCFLVTFDWIKSEASLSPRVALCILYIILWITQISFLLPPEHNAIIFSIREINRTRRFHGTLMNTHRRPTPPIWSERLLEAADQGEYPRSRVFAASRISRIVKLGTWRMRSEPDIQ